MDLWDQMLSADETKANSTDLFQNVADDEANTAASFVYDKMILESKDYGWLIQSLRTELSLERDKTTPTNHDPSIRRRILSMLPSGNISKRRRPSSHHVVFRLPAPLIEYLRSDRIVITSNSHNFQLTRISTYVGQTWPSFGRKVLSAVSFLGNALHDRTLCTRRFSSKMVLCVFSWSRELTISKPFWMTGWNFWHLSDGHIRLSDSLDRLTLSQLLGSSWPGSWLLPPNFQLRPMAVPH